MTDDELDSLADAHRWDTREGRRAMLRAVLDSTGTPHQRPIGWMAERSAEWLRARQLQDGAHLVTRVSAAPSEDEDVPVYAAAPRRSAKPAIAADGQLAQALQRPQPGQLENWRSTAEQLLRDPSAPLIRQAAMHLRVTYLSWHGVPECAAASEVPAV